ncbi:preprotein translocase subunit YajC [Nocardia cyriacigeorgica]|jgi:preprotein translocase subunit YajC|uniref:preprotein translocase subunit YajC n=1 Tax=Nocardia cyriacigeorgica TaxID=135487 RepID=UPI0003197947|nr:preprotein translocase subunit YajC [Nocardia cyriacigeorgica]MBF6087911.1 preprotein translocase subunit YajC [Nocardia cyriacigeorgica]MBF6094169.1 preprotein translocase subunit YajC [Nocardia cyriacigeorgica]MBF6396192.1 preprotein translocase subunit YajC [Nocardia cyriacigeorgica]MBF6401824.1 preprotein translocase subunit YajC [Nocardia cyriacigeorgica]MBF6416855.1 preprotein translocase subunit YajC [Nocardia cyriacigeorgica]
MELLFPLLLVALLVPMFLGVRRQKREAEKVAAMQDGLKVGDQVITTSGLYGTVVEVDDTTVDLEIAEEVVTTWLRQAIREVRVDDEAEVTTGDTEADEAPGTTTEETAEQTETRLTKD